MDDCREIDREYEGCIYFLAEKLRKSNNCSDTLIHSIRVGLNIQKDGFDSDLVKAGILHDIFEDTNIKETEVRDNYNKRIVDLILTTTANYSIGKEKEVLIDMYTRASNYGKEALILKCYDIEDKIKYYKDSNDKRIVNIHNYKYKLFLDISREKISSYKIWKIMQKEFEECKKIWKKKSLI